MEEHPAFKRIIISRFYLVCMTNLCLRCFADGACSRPIRLQAKTTLLKMHLQNADAPLGGEEWSFSLANGVPGVYTSRDVVCVAYPT